MSSSNTAATQVDDSETGKKLSQVEDLFTFAMKREWEKVIGVYKKDERAHMAKITRSDYTALHIAVSCGQEEHVKELVNLVSVKALEIQNERGNTPLHLAAALGNVSMCETIAKKDPSLVGIMNNDRETPLFLAALNGKKDAFLCLHYICTPKDCDPKCYSYCRREDGETILHCAINGDYFDLAFQIITHYEDLVNSFNADGFSPLHLLANRPSAFKSGSHLRRWHKIIYHCTIVDELKAEGRDHFGTRVNKTVKCERVPENYKTCFSFMSVLLNMAEVFVTRNNCGDTENPEFREAAETRGKPSHYDTCFDVVKLLSKAMLIVIGLGYREIQKIREKKENHKWSVQIMNKLLEGASTYKYEDSGMNPLAAQLFQKEDETMPYKFFNGGEDVKFGNINEEQPLPRTSDQQDDNLGKKGSSKEVIVRKTVETPILIAAKNGVTEMVEKILELFPVAIHDRNPEKKNIVLLAVENRQPDVYRFLLKRNDMKDSVFCKVDKDGNSALHLAAKLGDYKPWLIPGAALQMQWEIKWYEFVKTSMPLHFFPRYNYKSHTAKDIFTSTHIDIVKDGSAWLTNTSQSCSVVAALIATVAFATASTVPGGTDDKNGRPTLENHPAFVVFAITSLVALCCSVTSMIMFLSILTSRFQEKDFGTELPTRLLIGLTSLFMAIGSMLASFCAGHFFVLKDELKYAALPVYAVTCLPVTFFAILQFPLYVDLVWATFKTVPQRSYKVFPQLGNHSLQFQQTDKGDLVSTLQVALETLKPMLTESAAKFASRKHV